MSFIIEDLSITLKQNMIANNVWHQDCPLRLDQLELVKILHYDFFGEIKTGELVVHKKMSESTLKIFYALKQLKFPINQVSLIDKFFGNDELSMKHNNSSCFNFRKIANSNLLSMHSYGLAIDLNPLQNPVLTFENGICSVHPIEGEKYLNRSEQRPGMVETIVNIFIENGFTSWGGDWNSPIDYHHFQIKRSELENFI